jgi:hypothetical protein
MRTAQQIIGVNERLGNFAVPQMQGTTRCIYDTFSFGQTTLLRGQAEFFTNAAAKIYPETNISQNRFEVGESLAIQGFSMLATINSLATINAAFEDIQPYIGFSSYILNFYIGNQRVIKDLDLMYGLGGVGRVNGFYGTSKQALVYLETPIVIPPQIEFYATVNFGSTDTEYEGLQLILNAFGPGTLLNTKETF